MLSKALQTQPPECAHHLVMFAVPCRVRMVYESWLLLGAVGSILSHSESM